MDGTPWVVKVPHAWSAYTLTTLKMPTQSSDQRLNIDTNSRVTGTVTLLAGFPGPSHNNPKTQAPVSVRLQVKG